ncbi:hypothetical protein CIB87_02095 [Priestia megaterium]|uniref:ChrR-like cupin domain-containing protein n=1 Tax=Priestia megaterium TaxID=1404 RepID=A0AA86HWN6_PRIMG|nr:cupin domain-containing protein [Priestia megaterium]AXI27858.1 hypothetical protein CIB87_02095 [Priestia megaterium]
MNFKLPVLHTLDQLGKLSETEINFESYSANERSSSDIHWLFRPEETGGSGAALIRYKAGGTSPLHVHTGFELAYIIDGEFITDQGTVKKNDLILLPPGSQHNSRSETGALVLIIWEKPAESVEGQ